jgi:hypothetical protein
VQHPRDALLVEALDVGQGDSILLISPEGKTLLVDAGGFVNVTRPAEQEFDIGEEVVSAALWERASGISTRWLSATRISITWEAFQRSFATSIRANYGWAATPLHLLTRRFSTKRGEQILTYARCVPGRGLRSGR